MRRWLLFAVTLGTLLAQEIPRPEYPQPQFEREQWLNLNGEWEFEFDDQNAGLEENWAAGAKRFSRRIMVPFAFESKLSGIGDPSFHPWVWYRRSVTLPEEWKCRRVLLNFGAVDYQAMVWVNGRLAGEHVGGHVPFWFDVTHLLKDGANVITVRAHDSPTDRYIPRGKQFWEPESRGIFYSRTTGIWQTVWLGAAGESYLERVRIMPSNSGVVRFEARIGRPQPGLIFTAEIHSEEAPRATARAEARRVFVSAQVAHPRLWSPGSPNLYDVTFELSKDGVVLDRVRSYLGFRSIHVEKDRVHLNNRPIFLKMVLDQGYWPESNLTPPSDEAIQYDIRMTKEMGFNGARKHQKLEDPRYLYWADKMGLLVSSEMANAYLFDEEYVGRFTDEWRKAVERDYNHPSIIIWVPMNENWGTPDLSDPRQQSHLKALYTLTKSLDATRVVVDNDGWEHTDMTDLFAIHDYARTGDLLYERDRNLATEGIPVRHNARSFLAPGYEYNGSPIVLSEFGGIAYILPGQQVPSGAWGYAGVEPTHEAALERLRGLYEAIAKIPAFAGLCYTQLTDVEQEINGLLTYDRKPRFDPKIIREINSLIP